MALTEQQRAARHTHVGASEVGALFGLDERKTRYQLWHEKKGLFEPQDISEVERVFWGNVLEPAIAVGIAQQERWQIRKVEEYWRAPDVRGMGASADYEIVSDARGPIPLEIKNVDRLVFREWPDEEPPVRFQLQVQQQIACRAGAPAGVLAVLVGGNAPRIYEYDRHEASIARIKAGILEFWESIDRNEPPPPDFYADLDVIRALYQYVREGSIERFIDPRLVELCELYKGAGEEEKEAQRRKAVAKAEILTIINDVEEAHCEGWKVLAAWRDEVEIPASTRKAYRDFRIFPVTNKSRRGRR